VNSRSSVDLRSKQIAHIASRRINETLQMTAGLLDNGGDAAALKARIAELEAALGTAREALITLRNENQSLQTSLDLVVAENTRLSDLFAEREAEVANVRSRIEQLKALLNAAEAKDRTPSAAVAVSVGPADASRIGAAQPKPMQNTEKLLHNTIAF
jgi:predicted nuclease with TOPRIM domain